MKKQYISDAYAIDGSYPPHEDGERGETPKRRAFGEAFLRFLEDFEFDSSGNLPTCLAIEVREVGDDLVVILRVEGMGEP